MNAISVGDGFRERIECLIIGQTAGHVMETSTMVMDIFIPRYKTESTCGKKRGQIRNQKKKREAAKWLKSRKRTKNTAIMTTLDPMM
jgi:hypothetical protein